jgi:hypothetical protein
MNPLGCRSTPFTIASLILPLTLVVIGLGFFFVHAAQAAPTTASQEKRIQPAASLMDTTLDRDARCCWNATSSALPEQASRTDCAPTIFKWNQSRFLPKGFLPLLPNRIISLLQRMREVSEIQPASLTPSLQARLCIWLI